MERSHLITNINDFVDLVGTTCLIITVLCNDIIDLVIAMSDYKVLFNDIVDLVRTMSDYNSSIY